MKRACNYVVLSLIILALIISIGCNRTGTKTDGKGGTGAVSNKSFPTKLENPDVSILFWEGFEKEWFYEPIKTFEQKYGGKVSIVETVWKEIETKIIAMVTAGDAPDIVFWSRNHMPKYAINGILQPIDDYIDINDPIWDGARDIMEQFRYNGKLYGVATFPQTFFVYYNKTMFENNGVKTPMEYYKEGKWDWKTFEEVATKLTMDTLRSGKIDQFGAYSWENSVFVISNGGDIVSFEDDGGIKLTLNDPKVIEALQFTQDAVLKHKYMPAQIDRSAAFIQGRLAMNIDRTTFAMSDLKDGDMKDEWDIVPCPKGPSVEKPVYAANAPHWGITNGAKNPEGAAVLLYLRQKNENENLQAYLKETFNDEQTALILEMAKSTQAIRYAGIGNLVKGFNQMINQHILKGKPVLTAIEENIPVMQTEIDLTLSNTKR